MQAGVDPFQQEEDDTTSKTFAISRRKRAPTSAEDSENREVRARGQGLSRLTIQDGSLSLEKRSVHDYRKFLADESSNPKRAGGGVSVVQRNNGSRTSSTSTASRSVPAAKARDSGRETHRLGSSNSVLMDRAKRFA